MLTTIHLDRLQVCAPVESGVSRFRREGVMLLG